MKIEILLTEAEIADEFSEAISSRDVPEKFFYWFPLSVRSWQALSQETIYDTLRGAWATLGAKIEGVLRHFDKQVPLISFGAGDGRRDLALLQPLIDKGYNVTYYPVDASQAMLEAACAAAEDADLENVQGIKADISSPTHLLLASDITESPKLLVLAGNTLGAFDPLDQIRHLAACMHEGDRLIVDGEILMSDTLDRRNSEELAAFISAPLASIGISSDDGAIRFEQKQDERQEGLYQIARHFRAERDLRTIVAGQEILMERGEKISMNFQYVYTAAAFRWLVEEHGGLKILDAAASEDGRYIIAVCSK